jgi:hypothetical protein
MLWRAWVMQQGVCSSTSTQGNAFLYPDLFLYIHRYIDCVGYRKTCTAPPGPRLDHGSASPVTNSVRRLLLCR